MQNKISNASMSDTFHTPIYQIPFGQQKKRTVLIEQKPNATPVTKLNLKDKAGLVFVVVVLLTLQLFEKVKLLK